MTRNEGVPQMVGAGFFAIGKQLTALYRVKGLKQSASRVLHLLPTASNPQETRIGTGLPTNWTESQSPRHGVT
jgi:hypothetical protein